MFVVTAKAPNRRSVLFIVFLACLALVSIPFLRGHSASADDPPQRLDTNEQRIVWLNKLGWEAEPEPVESLRLTLPKTLEEPYRSYNTLQLKQGYDLTPYLGKTLERCTYRVTNYPGRSDCQADLYLYDGAVVAGDIICTGADGFIDTLEFPS